MMCMSLLLFSTLLYFALERGQMQLLVASGCCAGNICAGIRSLECSIRGASGCRRAAPGQLPGGRLERDAAMAHLS